MKKFLTVFFTFTLYFNLVTQANAANLGGWTLGNPIAQGASAIVNGTKTAVINGANVIKNSTAKITPPASSVAKVLARGAAGYALSVAVEQLLGSVDWVLDPANNRIVYTNTNDPSKIPNFRTYYYVTLDNTKYYYSDIDSLISKITSYLTINYPGSRDYQPNRNSLLNAQSGTSNFYYRMSGNYQYSISYYKAVNPNYDPSIEDSSESKSIPLSTVANKVISNAEQGDTRAQAATMAAAQDIINEAETDNTKARPIVNQLEANSETATDETATGEAAPKADPVTGEQAPPLDLSLEFPKFCTWAPTICEAAQVVLTFPNTLTEWWETANEKADSWTTSISEAWTAVKEWASSEKEPEDTELEIPEPEQPEIDTEIAFGGSCPADHQAEINMGVGVIKMPISYEPICTTVSTAKPVLIFVGFFIAALIIGGVKTE